MSLQVLNVSLGHAALGCATAGCIQLSDSSLRYNINNAYNIIYNMQDYRQKVPTAVALSQAGRIPEYLFKTLNDKTGGGGGATRQSNDDDDDHNNKTTRSRSNSENNKSSTYHEAKIRRRQFASRSRTTTERVRRKKRNFVEATSPETSNQEVINTEQSFIYNTTTTTTNTTNGPQLPPAVGGQNLQVNLTTPTPTPTTNSSTDRLDEVQSHLSSNSTITLTTSNSSISDNDNDTVTTITPSPGGAEQTTATISTIDTMEIISSDEILNNAHSKVEQSSDYFGGTTTTTTKQQSTADLANGPSNGNVIRIHPRMIIRLIGISMLAAMLMTIVTCFVCKRYLKCKNSTCCCCCCFHLDTCSLMDDDDNGDNRPNTSYEHPLNGCSYRTGAGLNVTGGRRPRDPYAICPYQLIFNRNSQRPPPLYSSSGGGGGGGSANLDDQLLMPDQQQQHHTGNNNNHNLYTVDQQTQQQQQQHYSSTPDRMTTSDSVVPQQRYITSVSSSSHHQPLNNDVAAGYNVILEDLELNNLYDPIMAASHYNNNTTNNLPSYTNAIAGQLSNCSLQQHQYSDNNYNQEQQCVRVSNQCHQQNATSSTCPASSTSAWSTLNILSSSSLTKARLLSAEDLMNLAKLTEIPIIIAASDEPPQVILSKFNQLKLLTRQQHQNQNQNQHQQQRATTTSSDEDEPRFCLLAPSGTLTTTTAAAASRLYNNNSNNGYEQSSTTLLSDNCVAHDQPYTTTTTTSQLIRLTASPMLDPPPPYTNISSNSTTQVGNKFFRTSNSSSSSSNSATGTCLLESVSEHVQTNGPDTGGTNCVEAVITSQSSIPLATSSDSGLTSGDEIMSEIAGAITTASCNSGELSNRATGYFEATSRAT